MDIAGWNEMYRSGHRGKEDAPTALLVEMLEKLPAGNAIDLAAGAGRNAIYMAEHGWNVTAVDGSEKAIALLKQRADARGVYIETCAADLTDPLFTLRPDTFNLVVVAYYLQRDLFAEVKRAVCPGGIVIAIAHTPEAGEPWSDKRVRTGELRSFFDDWPILWEYEGPSRDPAHRRPVAEITAQRPTSC